MAHVIVGTAGHIDHGKSSLVRALTGTDPDRLPEEKQRGITLDLGYAFLDDFAAIIDVPGHERLIRNMVAGAATIDFAILVVAADDGVMPQTLEHLQILRFLGVKSGAIVVTKIDNAEPEWLAMVGEQIRDAVRNTFLESAPLFHVDSLSGRGVAEFRQALISTLTRLSSRQDHGIFRLPVDRVFMMKGRGTVVTGTILSGHIGRDARVVILPGGYDVRVKRLETHGAEVETLGVGQRAALNLIGDTERLSRGKTLALPDTLIESSLLRAVVEPIPNTPAIKDRQRVRILIATQEVLGRVQIVHQESPQRTYVNLLLEEPVVAVWGDRFILRRYSPMETLGGGRILEPDAPRLKVRDVPSETKLSVALDDDRIASAVVRYIVGRGEYGVDIGRIRRVFGLAEDRLTELLASHQEIETIANYLFGHDVLNALMVRLRHRLTELHKKTPQSSGFSRNDLLSDGLNGLPGVVADNLLSRLLESHGIVQQGPLYREPDRKIELTPEQNLLAERICIILREKGFSPPSSAMLSEALNRPRTEIEKTLVILERMGKCRRLGNDLFFEMEVFDRSIQRIREAVAGPQGLSVADASQLLNSSRKYVVPFLEYLDSQKITIREGNLRIKGSR